jgi:hypothetical protein
MDATSVRRRPAASDKSSTSEKPTSDSSKGRERDDDADYDADEAEARGFGVLDVVRVLLGLLLLSSAMSWFVHGDSLLWGWKPWFANVDAVLGRLVSIPCPAHSLSLEPQLTGALRGAPYR